MRKTMAATALSFLMAVGGGAALADTGGHAPSSSSTTPSASSNSGTNAQAPAPIGFEEEEVTTAPWTVERVDKQNRNLVLRAPDGTQNTVNIPMGTPGFDTLKKGDTVQLDYFDATVVGVAPPAKSSGQSGAASSASSNNQASGTSNGGNRKVRSIRKVSPSNSTGHGQNTPSTGGTPASQNH